jgi:hypothetical protein
VKANSWLEDAPFTSFTSYRNLPLGSAATDVGFAPATNGEPGTGVRLPLFASIEKAEMLPVVWVAVELFAT